MRRGVAALLDSEDDLEVIGEAGTAESAIARIPALMPDVAVLDVRLPDGNGVDVCREVRSRVPGLACLMLTSFADDDALFDAVMAGAAMLQRLRDQTARKDPLAALTDQERQILDLVGEGLTNRQIGERMFLAEKTVKNYVSNLLSKLDMQRRTQAAALAARLRADRKQ
ncbi:response regulator transcription factor [Nonomuraea monospora]|uniref:Response regulator transcription factor n=1 Tax=Nonomuraea monospora TaxID=568818 RepID=A0ABN3D321_9ACTN